MRTMAAGWARLERIRGALAPAEWARVAAMAGTVVVLNGLGWTMLAAASGRPHPGRSALFGVGTGVLAYTLGMRHAFDADHIAAIDNTTRKLLAEHQRPLGVGFFFSLGHSSVVFALAIALNFGVRQLNGAVVRPGSGLHQWTAVIGTSVSGGFLFLIAALNVAVLVSILRLSRGLRRGEFDDEGFEQALANRGLMNRVLGGLSKRIDTSWKMFPVGVLFGLGFDTATEVALLVLAGTAVVGGLPFYAVASLPVLFAAGMCLFDTIDGCFMNFAYEWAFSNPARKLFYNLTITGLSVVAALFIGTVEIAGLIGQEARLSGGVWGFLEGFNVNKAGFVMVGLFAATWVVAAAVWRYGGVERRWSVEAGDPRAG